jgi:ABC-type multidrug transport system ATPase subunit
MISPMQYVVEVRAVACVDGPRKVLERVDLALAPGQVHGVLGPRWAGKTALLRVLAGELSPTAGRVVVPERMSFVADDGGTPIEERLDPSTRRRVGLARAVAGAPDLLLIDEPTDGFDTDTIAVTRSIVMRFAGQGGTVVWATRRLGVLSGVADGVTLLVDGRTRFTGTPAALAERAVGTMVSDLRRVA